MISILRELFSLTFLPPCPLLLLHINYNYANIFHVILLKIL